MEKAGIIWRYCLITQFISPFPDKIETYERDEETMREIREVNPVIYHGCEDWKIKNSEANRTDAYPDKRFWFL